MVQPDPTINDHPPPPPQPPLDAAYEQHQRAPPQLDEAYEPPHQQEPQPLYQQHEPEPPPLYEQHDQEPPQQGFAIPMPQPAAQPPVVVHIHNNIGVPNPPPPPPLPLPPPPPPPPPPQPRYIYPQLWHTGLFDCVDDLENAIITLFCPCVTFGQIAAAIDNGTSCETSGCIYTCVALIIGMPCIISCTYRTRLRGRFGLVEDPCSDCMTHCCCEYCALCQEYRELNHRGCNPSAGWMKIENNQNMNQQQQMNPPPGQYMR